LITGFERLLTPLLNLSIHYLTQQVRVMGRILHGGKSDVVRPTQHGFGRRGPKEEEKLEAREAEVLRQLKITWKKFEYAEAKHKENYKNIAAHLKGTRYSAKDVENFSLALAEFQRETYFPEKAGFFLSALINNSRDADFVIHTRHLSQRIDNLGYGNTKNITVEGNAGYAVGYAMKGGTITVNGNADFVLGFGMKAGAIIVNGNAGSDIGWGMQGGAITVNGNAEAGVGDVMFGGEIHLNGKHKGLGNRILGGKIYHNGKLIVDK